MENKIKEILKNKQETTLSEIYSSLNTLLTDKKETAKVRSCLNLMVKEAQIKRLKRGLYSL